MKTRNTNHKTGGIDLDVTYPVEKPNRNTPTHPGALSRKQLTRRTLYRIGAVILMAIITLASIAAFAYILTI